MDTNSAQTFQFHVTAHTHSAFHRYLMMVMALSLLVLLLLAAFRFWKKISN